MASRKDAKNKLDMMVEILDSLDDARKQFWSQVRKAEKPPLREVDYLLLYAASDSFQSKARDLRDAIGKVRGSINKHQALSQARDDPAEKIFRILSRSKDVIDVFTKFWSNDVVTRGLLGGTFYDDFKIDLRPRFQRVKRMAAVHVIEGLSDPASFHWPCMYPHETFVCGLEDHFHSLDGLVWPIEEKALENSVPSASTPAITFRNFKFRTLPDDPQDKNSLESAVKAMRLALEVKDGSTSAIDEAFEGEDMIWIESTMQRKTNLRLLSDIAEEIRPVIQETGWKLELGILLPGSSQVFWYDSLVHSALRKSTAIIQAYEYRQQQVVSDRFKATEIWRKSNRDNIVQTMSFLDLPAEIRVMIYNKHLEAVDYDPFTEAQPSISLTCRLVNNEMMGLLLRKRGWFISH